MKQKIGAALYGVSMFLLSFSVAMISCILTIDNAWQKPVTWFSLLYLCLIVGCAVLGGRLSQPHNPLEDIPHPLEMTAACVMNVLISGLILDMGKSAIALLYAVIPYAIVAVIILVRRWSHLTEADKIILKWTWIPLLL